MNKEEFISRLESSLDIFEDNIKKEEVEKYLEVIEERQKNGETGRGNRMNSKTLAYIHRILSSQERVLQKLYEKDVENNAGESTISSSLTKWEEAKEALADFEGTEW